MGGTRAIFFLVWLCVLLTGAIVSNANPGSKFCIIHGITISVFSAEESAIGTKIKRAILLSNTGKTYISNNIRVISKIKGGVDQRKFTDR